MKISKVCFLSQAAKAVSLPHCDLNDWLESNIEGLPIASRIMEIKSWPVIIRNDIRHNREMLQQDGPETIPELQALATKFGALHQWMKDNGFTHFIEDVSEYNDIDNPIHY